MTDDLEQRLADAGDQARTSVDPDAIWTQGTVRRRRRTLATRTAVAAVVLAIGVPTVATIVDVFRETPSGIQVVGEGSPVPPGARCPTPEVFGPASAATVTRATAATRIVDVLRAAGIERPDDLPDRFRDDDGTAAEPAFDELAALDVIRGRSADDTEAVPELELTRGQLASMVVRTYRAVGGGTLPVAEDRFADDDGTPHSEDIDVAFASALMTGTSPTEFSPDRPASERELTVALERLRQLLDGVDPAACP